MTATTTPAAPMGRGKNQGDGQPPRVSGGSLLSPRTLWKATPDAFKKLDPRVQIKNPVMFVVEVGALLTLYTAITKPSIFNWTIVVWLWLTVVFANIAEAVAEGRGKAQAETLRKTKRETIARRLVGWQPGQEELREEPVPGTQLTLGDHVVVQAGEIIPGDGDVVEGVASVDESAITGESAPVIRESGGDRSAVTGGTKVLSDRIVVQITSKPGETFIDRMIALVEGAKRQKTPNEIALNILLAALTIIFMLAVVTLQPMAFYSGAPQSLVILVALLVALIPTTIGALLSAIGIAGMDRLVQRNVLAMSGRAVEAAGDVNTLLLDKTGTITIGNRQATEFLPVAGVTAAELADAAQLSSMADYTPEGRSIAVLAKEKYGLRERAEGELQARGVRRVHRADPDERHRPARAAGRAAGAQGRGRVGRRVGARQRRYPARRARLHGGRDLRRRRHPAGRSRAIQRHGTRTWRDLPEGHRQGRHRRAVRRDAQDGHQDRHDHRRQPAHRQGDRGRVRRG